MSLVCGVDGAALRRAGDMATDMLVGGAMDGGLFGNSAA